MATTSESVRDLGRRIKQCVGLNPERNGDPIVIHAPVNARAEVEQFCREIHNALVLGDIHYAVTYEEFEPVLFPDRALIQRGHSIVVVGANSLSPRAVRRLMAGDYIRPNLLILVIFCPLHSLCGRTWPTNFPERILQSFVWPNA